MLRLVQFVRFRPSVDEQRVGHDISLNAVKFHLPKHHFCLVQSGRFHPRSDERVVGDEGRREIPPTREREQRAHGVGTVDAIAFLEAHGVALVEPEIDVDGVLLNLRFTAVGYPGAMSPLTFEDVIFNDGEPQVNVIDGRVELSIAAAD